MKTIIIDVHNVMHKIRSVEDLMSDDITKARYEFLRLLSNYADKYSSYKFVAVFDGTAKNIRSPRKNISVLRSGSRLPADKIIKDLISKNTSSLTEAVSSDHEIVGYARACSVNTVRSEDFAKLLTEFSSAKKSEQEKPSRVSVRDLKELSELFAAKSDSALKTAAKENISEPKSLPKSLPKEKINPGDFFSPKKKKIVPETKKESKPSGSSRNEIDEFLKLFEAEDK